MYVSNATPEVHLQGPEARLKFLKPSLSFEASFKTYEKDRSIDFYENLNYY